MPIKTIDGAIVGLIKSHLAPVASSNNYRDLDNLPSVVSEFENDENYIKEVNTIPEETVIELWDLDSDSDPEAIHIPNIPITNPQIIDAWDGNENGQDDDGLDTITEQQVEDAWDLDNNG